MSLNKFSSSEFKKEWMNINCNELKATNLVIEDNPPLQLSFSKLAPTTVINTVTETDLVDNVGNGSFSIPADELSVGDVGRVYVSGDFSCLATTNFTINFYANAVLINSLLISNIPITTNKGFIYELKYTVIAAGAPTVAQIQSESSFKTNSDASLNFLGNVKTNLNSTDFNTTVENIFSVKVIFGAPSVNNSVTCTQAQFEKI